MREKLLDFGAAAVLVAFAAGFAAFLIWLGSEENSQKHACNAKGGTWSYSAARKANVCTVPTRSP